jgi:hypothetical protein
MGFTFKGLTSSAILSAHNPSANNDHKDIADVPASVQGHTSMDAARPDEKLGSPREPSISQNSDEELNKVDTTAEQGVQAVQAATLVWKKRDLILAYILYVYATIAIATKPPNISQYVVHPILHCLRIEHRQHPLALRH